MSREDWEEFERGVNLFNVGKFWHAHEAWEIVWQRHGEDERLFFQGLIQLAAAYHQLITKRSYRGLMNNFNKAYAKLEVFQPEYLGVFITPLLRFIEQGRKEIQPFSDEAPEQFNYNLIPKIQFYKHDNPDLLAEIRDALTSQQFLEGVRLFNTGYYWEAHESWEDVWREQNGDAKTFVQAFVQAAAAYSFIKLGKFSSVSYLFDKAVEKFCQFEHIDSGLQLKPLIEHIQSNIVRLRSFQQKYDARSMLTGIPTIIFSTLQQKEPTLL